MYADRKQDIQRFFNRGGTPITLIVIVANLVTFFAFAGWGGHDISRFIRFFTPDWPRYVWTALTWPLSGAYMPPLNLLCAAGWFYLFASSLERSWGSRNFAVCLCGVSILMAISVWAASFVLGIGELVGLWVLAGAVTVAWAAVNRREVVNIWFLPVSAPILMIIGAAMVWYHGGAGYGNPMIGLVALVGCAAAYWFATKGRHLLTSFGVESRSAYGSRNAPRRGGPRDSKPDPLGLNRLLRGRREREEERRLEDIFRRSGFDTEDRDRR
jgi:hypothetical protein